MIEDLRHAGNDETTVINLAIFHIDGELRTNGNSCNEKGLPTPVSLLLRLTQHIDDPAVFAEEGEQIMQMLNAEQRTAADTVLAAIATNDCTSSHCFFIDGPGGTGKTFLYTVIVHVLRGLHKKVLTVAYTGIAAILLPDGKTCHTAFCLPLNIQGDSTCHLSVDEKKI